MSTAAGAGPRRSGLGEGGGPGSVSPGGSSGGRGAGGAVADEYSTSIRDWLAIGADGVVTVYTGKVEVGQNIRTSLAQAVADELRVPLEAVRLVMADTGRTPFDPGTFGSRSTPGMAPLLRRAAAAAREVLLDVAAERWEANRDDLQVEGGRIVHPETGQALEFGELAQGQALAEVVPDDIPTLPRAAWRLSGTSAMKVGALALVTGAHRYASDVRRPGMRYGKMLRPAGFGATLRSLDVRGAEALPGVLVVQESGPDLTGLSGAGAAPSGAAGLPSVVGVVGPVEATATRAVAALRAQWDVPPQSTAGELFSYLKTHPANEDTERRFAGGPQHVAGSVEEGIAAADYTLRQTYTAAYVAHAPLETRVAVAEWGADGPAPGGPAPGEQLTVWTGTQRPFGVRRQLAERFGLPEEQVRVIVPDTGSGYGGKHYGDAAVEAALLARAAGAPVRVAWTREEEFSWAYFRPAGVIEVRSGARQDGTLLAWEHHTYNAGPAGIRTPYEVPHQHVEYHVTRTPLRQGSYRALASTANHFARECHMDELAHLMRCEPLAFRQRHLRDERMRNVLEGAAERFEWSARGQGAGHGQVPCSSASAASAASAETPVGGAGAAGGQRSGIGQGLSCGTEKGSYIATCAEVAVDRASGVVRVLRLVAAFECGAVVNPEHLRSQVAGALVQGIGGALFEAIDFADGRILNPRFSQYRVPRFDDTPAIEVVLLDRPDLPSAGGGETPIIGVAPAVANAVFDATGVRLRAMPLRVPPEV